MVGTNGALDAPFPALNPALAPADFMARSALVHFYRDFVNREPRNRHSDYSPMSEGILEQRIYIHYVQATGNIVPANAGPKAQRQTRSD
jgi:hypothetical protein